MQECWVKTGLTVILYGLLVVGLPEFYKAQQMQEEQLSFFILILQFSVSILLGTRHI